MMAEASRPELAQALRQGLRSLAKAVVVITCRHEGKRYAMAATAVSELSLDPPSMLICVNKIASLFLPLSAGADFCINILHADHVEISKRCSGTAKGEARFDIGSWSDSTLGIPVLDEAQAAFVCRNRSCTKFGTHGIFIGEVLEVVSVEQADPLIYVDGRYSRVQPTFGC